VLSAWHQVTLRETPASFGPQKFGRPGLRLPGRNGMSSNRMRRLRNKTHPLIAGMRYVGTPSAGHWRSWPLGAGSVSSSEADHTAWSTSGAAAARVTAVRSGNRCAALTPTVAHNGSFGAARPRWTLWRWVGLGGGLTGRVHRAGGLGAWAGLGPLLAWRVSCRTCWGLWVGMPGWCWWWGMRATRPGSSARGWRGPHRPAMSRHHGYQCSKLASIT
jgi:hypothetical protein